MEIKVCTSLISPKLHFIFKVRSFSSLSTPSHQHIIQLILDQKSVDQALQTFNWASNLPNFTHSQSTYQAIIHKLCTFRRFDIVHQMLDEMPHSINSSPNEHIFLTIIRGLGRARRIRDAMKILDLISNFGEKPSLKIFNSILNVLVKEDIDLARKFYRIKMMGSGVQGDDYTYGILMKGLCLTNRIGDGFKLLQVMKTRDVNPNVVVYNTLLHALCKNGKLGRARSLMNEIEDPNDVTFNILMSAYCKEHNLVQALVMLEKCFDSGFVPDVITVTKVVESLCNVGRLSEAVEVFDRVESKGGKVDVVAHNTLLKGFCSLGKVKVGYGLLKEMERKGCLPNVDTYNTLIFGFCNSGMFDSALDMFNDMKTDGITWNFDTYDMLIKGLFSGGRIEDGFKILELMEAGEWKASWTGQISPYNSVLYDLYKKNLSDEALEFLIKMRSLFTKAVDRSLRILNLCETGDIDGAKIVFSEGGSLNVLVYDSLIRALCEKGRLREALELMNEMVECGYVPVASTFNGLICGFCEQGRDGSALKLLDEMVSRGCLVDRGSYSDVIDVLCRKGNLQKASSLLFKMVEKGIVPNYLMWSSLLLCLSKEAIWLESTKSTKMLHLHELLL
ncbi:pentatricopeptide repeat-containing protein At2g17525, mitochondrial-like [Euphorbia lathyris]|uniref:pentatricopeptide repeat-containing protein At2g17525, mitochondrial-like n=1 Tax=Euphorbia lathyris TaxID=212925 RepID=UPI003313A763